MPIGLRNIKTAIAVTICVFISKLLKLEYPFYVAIAAIIAMESSVMDSFHTGKNRMLGTMIGAGIGFICALIQPGNAILCGVGIVVVIYLCNLLKWNKSTSIAGVVFIAIMVNLNGKSPFLYSLNRITDTLIGVSVAVAVNHFVLPPNHLAKIRRSSKELMPKIDHLIKKRFISGEAINLAEFAKLVSRFRKQVRGLSQDMKIRKKNIEEATHFQGVLGMLEQLLNHLRFIGELEGEPGFREGNVQKIQELFGVEEFQRLEFHGSESEIVFNYHVRKILGYYEGLKEQMETVSITHQA